MFDPIEEGIEDWPAIECRAQLRLLEAFFHKTLDDIERIEAEYGTGKGNPLGSELVAAIPPAGTVSTDDLLTLSRILGYAASLILAEVATELAEGRNEGGLSGSGSSGGQGQEEGR
jgi:hypothetical protein